VLRAALITPLSGPLAGYGRAGEIALRLWAEWFTGGVELFALDAHPDPVAALRRAERERPHLLFGPYGSGPARAVAAATTRLVWNHGGARVDPADHVITVPAPAETYFQGAIAAVHAVDPAARRAAVLHSGGGFARAVAAGAVAAAAALGLRAEPAALDVDAADGDLLLAVGSFAEERDATRRLLPGGWRAAAFVAAGVEEVLAGLGALREGLLGPAQWLASTPPSPDEGPTVGEFVSAFRRRAGSAPPYPAAQAFAAGVIAGRCLRDAGGGASGLGGHHDAALLAVARALDCTTLFGRFRLDPATGRQVGHQVLTVQWQDGVRRAVWPPERAQAPLRHPLTRRPVPGSRSRSPGRGRPSSPPP